MTDSVLHQPCGLPISEAEEKAIVDKWLRGVRSKGGKSRWKNHEPAPKDRPASPAVHPTRWATRRENQFRKSLVDGSSPWKKGVRLVANFSGLGEVLQAQYSFHSANSSAIFETKQGFQEAWEKAQAWILERKNEPKLPRAKKTPDEVIEFRFRSKIKDGVTPFRHGIRLIENFKDQGEVLEVIGNKEMKTFPTAEGFAKAYADACVWKWEQRAAKKKEKV